MGFAHNANTQNKRGASRRGKTPRIIDSFDVIAAAAEHYASEVRIYHLRKDGTKGRLLRTEPATLYDSTSKTHVRVLSSEGG